MKPSVAVCCTALLLAACDGGATDDETGDATAADVGVADGSGVGDVAADAPTDGINDGSGASNPDTTLDSDISSDTSPAECGNGVQEGREECDEGDANSDTTPNACRTDCRIARCGDAVVDDGEACDDGNQLGGDGCGATCAEESGPFEAEPNDNPAAASALPEGGMVRGGLTAGDRDCFAVIVPEQGFVDARVSDGADGCVDDPTLSLINVLSGETLASFNDDGDNPCPRIDAAAVDAARFMDESVYALCVDGLARNPVATYVLEATVGADSCDEPRFAPTAANDLDFDGIADVCDDDDDDDGVLDAEDNCPRVPNGVAALSAPVSEDGFVPYWLTLGPFNDTAPEACLPSVAPLFDAEATLAPRLGDRTLETPWRFARSVNNELDLRVQYGTGSARSGYAVVYIDSPVARDVVMRWGSDDGARVWWNGEQVVEVPDCRSAYADASQTPVSMQEGLNRLTMRIFDTGGEWGAIVRFYDEDAAAYLTDLTVQLSADGVADNQSDSDEDGVGDACDPD